MEAFSIQCTTCRARLKVRDEAMIGAILACPKCGSMVQVVPPVNWKRVAPTIAAAAAVAPPVEAVPLQAATAAAPAAHITPPPLPAMSKAAIAIRPLVTPNSTAAAAGLSAVTTAKSAMPSGVLAVGTSPNATPGSSQIGVAKTTAGKAAAATAIAAKIKHASAEASSGVVPAVDSITAEQVAGPLVCSWFESVLPMLRRDWMLLSGGAAVGVVLGVGAWLVLAARAPSDELADAEEVAQARALPREGESRPGKPTASSAAVRHTVSRPAAVPSEPASQTSREAIANSPKVDVPAASPVEPEPAVEAGFELPQIAPEQAIQEPAEPAPAIAPQTETVAINPAAEPEAGDRPEPNPADPAKPPAPAEFSKRAAIEGHLSDTLPAAEFKGVSLAQYLEFLSEFSTIPITIDVAALSKVGKTRKSPVTLKLDESTVSAALDAALSPHGLAYLILDDKIVVTAGRR